MIAQAKGQTLDLVTFWLFLSLYSKALDHSATAPPIILWNFSLGLVDIDHV